MIPRSAAVAIGFGMLVSGQGMLFAEPVPAARHGKLEEHFTKFNGLRIRYVAKGPLSDGVAGSGQPAIVLIHGWTCDSSFWAPQIDDFSKTHRVIAVDLPGHGGSAKPITDYTVEVFSGSVNAAMEHAKIRSAVIFGHSMGVPVAMQLIQDHPEKSLGFVAVDGAVWRNGGRRPTTRSAFLNRLHADYHTTAGAYIDSMFVSSTTPAMRTEIKRKMLSTPRHVAVSALDMLAESMVWERGPNSIPTLAIMAGKRDLEQIHRDLLPNLQYEIWPEAGHFLMTEQPERFNELVRSWMSKLPAGRSSTQHSVSNAN